nr:MAG TPA: putative tail fiber protein [Caudoviricetes sp.]
MSILKSILHHYNKTTKSYDTLHPETESAQITDWHSGIMASLASKTLGTVVDAITTDSVLGKLLKMVLTASGVKYNIAQNGYVCLGSFFGGLIIQWGYLGSTSNNSNSFTYPISFTNIPKTYCTSDDPALKNAIQSIYNVTKTGATRYSSASSIGGCWMAIGY